jgi:hypothetical protein
MSDPVIDPMTLDFNNIDLRNVDLSGGAPAPTPSPVAGIAGNDAAAGDSYAPSLQGRGGSGRTITLPRTESEQALLDISGDMWDQYQQHFIPIEDAWLDSIHQGGGSFQEAADMMNAEAAHQYAPYEENAYQGAFSQGIDPSSGAFLSLATDLALQKGGAAGTAMNEAMTADDVEFYRQSLAASRYGRGVGTEGISGISAAGEREAIADRMARNQAANNSAARNATRQTFYNTLGTGLGLAGGYALSQYNPTEIGGDVVIQKPAGTSWETEVGDPYVFHSGYVSP